MPWDQNKPQLGLWDQYFNANFLYGEVRKFFCIILQFLKHKISCLHRANSRFSGWSQGESEKDSSGEFNNQSMA
jgi:hypothetical protein